MQRVFCATKINSAPFQLLYRSNTRIMLQTRERHVIAQSHKQKMFVLERTDSLRVGPTPSLKLSLVTTYKYNHGCQFVYFWGALTPLRVPWHPKSLAYSVIEISQDWVSNPKVFRTNNLTYTPRSEALFLKTGLGAGWDGKSRSKYHQNPGKCAFLLGF